MPLTPNPSPPKDAGDDGTDDRAFFFGGAGGCSGRRRSNLARLSRLARRTNHVRQGQGNFGAGLGRTQFHVLGRQLLLQRLILLLDRRDDLRTAARLARLGGGQRAGQHLLAQLPKALFANPQPSADFLNPALAGDGVEHRLDALLGGARSFLAIHDFRSGRTPSTHFDLLSLSMSRLLGHTHVTIPRPRSFALGLEGFLRLLVQACRYTQSAGDTPLA
jgi:hypothetical protein